jgi:chromosomal replication initiation ATPase DnaA
MRMGVDGAARRELEGVARLVAATFAVDDALVLGRRRHSAAVTRARHVAIYLAHVALGRSQARLARALGRGAAGVAYAVRAVEDARERDRALDAAIAVFEDMLRDARSGS